MLRSSSTAKVIWVLGSRQRSNAVPEERDCRGAFLVTLSFGLELCPCVCSTLGKSEPKPCKPSLQGALAGMLSVSCTKLEESVLSLLKCASSSSSSRKNRHLSNITKRDENCNKQVIVTQIVKRPEKLLGHLKYSGRRLNLS